MKKNQILAQRLGEMLTLLNNGERLDVHQLAEMFNVSIRTIQRDIKQRLVSLEWLEEGPRYYQLNKAKLGILDKQDIERFAQFASIADLFPKIDREFFQEKIVEAIKVKGFQYENISHLENEFKQIQQAIQNHRYIHFSYIKSSQNISNFYQIAPYALINKNGIWYLIGTQQDKQKTFCFTQISMLRTLDETFEPNPKFIDEINNNDSVSHGNQLPEVVIKVSKYARPYFLRRNLLPNQKILHKLESGELLLSCENVNELDIVPLVQYWIPHLTIVSPIDLQNRMMDKLQQYLRQDSVD